MLLSEFVILGVFSFLIRKLTSYFKRIKKMILDEKRNMIKDEYEDFDIEIVEIY